MFQIKGPTPIMKQVAGRPMLSQTYMKSLAELQPFFNTLCHSKLSKGSFVVTSHASSLQGRTQGQGRSADKTTMQKSVSAPEFKKSIQNSTAEVTLPSTYQSNREYIEELVERDFLEPLAMS